MKLIEIIKSKRPSVVFAFAIEKFFSPKVTGIESIKHLFLNKQGIEIGGPSDLFKANGQMPLYPFAAQVDGCNFSSQTAWEGNITEGKTYAYDEAKKGHQFICDGVDVPIIPKGSYDFVLSCNNLEHIANPLKAIANWLLLLKPTGGALVLVLPRKESNFDHKRPTTTFKHLLEDYQNNTGEDDLTVLEEVLKLHDLRLDPRAGTKQQFKERSENNFNNRCLHHHIFDVALLVEICQYFKLKIVLQQSKVGNHIVVATS